MIKDAVDFGDKEKIKVIIADPKRSWLNGSASESEEHPGGSKQDT